MPWFYCTLSQLKVIRNATLNCTFPGWRRKSGTRWQRNHLKNLFWQHISIARDREEASIWSESIRPCGSSLDVAGAPGSFKSIRNVSMEKSRAADGRSPACHLQRTARLVMLIRGVKKKAEGKKIVSRAWNYFWCVFSHTISRMDTKEKSLQIRWFI